MPIKARAVAPPPVATWTGCYIGASVGGAWHHFKPTYEDGGGNGFGGSGWGVIGGGTLGCNWQTNNWVWGLEGDFSGLSDGAKSAGPVGKGNATKSDLSWLATARARLGYAVAGGMMAYITGGVAFAKVKSAFSPNGFGASCDQALCSKTANKNKVGWTPASASSRCCRATGRSALKPSMSIWGNTPARTLRRQDQPVQAPDRHHPR